MSAPPPPKTRGTSKVTQAAAGIAGALAFIGIGWAVGARSASPHAVSQSAALPNTVRPTSPISGAWGGDDDGEGQWGTIPPSSGITPAQPGTNIGVTPPQTGTAGSGVAPAPPGTAVGTSVGVTAPPTGPVGN